MAGPTPLEAVAPQALALAGHHTADSPTHGAADLY